MVFTEEQLDSFTVPLHCPKGRQLPLGQLPAVRAVLRDCHWGLNNSWNSHWSCEPIMQWGTGQSQSIFRPTNHKRVMPANRRPCLIPHWRSYCHPGRTVEQSKKQPSMPALCDPGGEVQKYQFWHLCQHKHSKLQWWGKVHFPGWELTPWCLEMHIFSGKLGPHWFRQRFGTCLVPNHYLNKSWLYQSRNQCQRNLICNTNIAVEWNKSKIKYLKFVLSLFPGRNMFR